MLVPRVLRAAVGVSPCRGASFATTERAAAVVDALLAQPRVHPRSLAIDSTERARRRHAFFSSLCSEAFGNRRPKFVHVAGTKGKGSVCEMIRAGLACDAATATPRWRRVGCFTSPHLHSCRERIRVGGAPIGLEEIATCGAVALDKLRTADDYLVHDNDLYYDARDGAEPRLLGWGAVFFDRLLATALLHFGEQRCDIVVLEAGIGAKHDTTNFMAAADVALGVVTSISRDHTALLGETLAEIAQHKAGVMRRGVTTLTPSSQPPEALAVLRSEAERTGATLEVVDFCAQDGPSTVAENAALAQRACELLGVASAGVGLASWPARFEVLRPSLDGKMATLLVDAAHNGYSVVRLFADAATSLRSVRRWIVIFGCGEEKEGRLEMLAALEHSAAQIQEVLLVEAAWGARELPPSKRPAAASALATALRDGPIAKVAPHFPPSTSAALRTAYAAAALHEDVGVLVCGSLYLAAEAREWAVDTDPSCVPPHDWARTLR